MLIVRFECCEMPRKSTKPKITKSSCCTRQFSTQTDFTINQYANASGKTPPGRIKKAAANAVISEVHGIKGAQMALEVVIGATGGDEEPSWFDKDLDEFNITADLDLQPEEDVETAVADHEKETRTNRRKRRLKGSECEDTGITYPIDLWYVLSEHVHPEDISIFSRLCHGAYTVTNTIQFWKRLYHRICTDLTKLPSFLQPVCLERVHGLRQRVIRTLFFQHAAFISRTVTTAPFENQPLCYNLVGHLCLLSWHELNKNMWNFNFKFRKERMGEINSLIRLKGEPQSLHSGYKDLHHNIENDSYVLRVTCQSFSGIPSVMGLVLTSLNLRISHNMRYFSLRLLFDTSLKQVTGTNIRESQSLEKVVILDPVVDVRVFPWWHPNYPHQGM